MRNGRGRAKQREPVFERDEVKAESWGKEHVTALPPELAVGSPEVAGEGRRIEADGEGKGTRRRRGPMVSLWRSTPPCVRRKLAWTASTQGEGRRSKMKRKEEGGFFRVRGRRRESILLIRKEGGLVWLGRNKGGF